MYYAGKRQDAKDGRTQQVINPATGDAVAEVPVAGPEDVNEAVGRARRAFDLGEWRKRSPRDRQRVLLDLSNLIRKRADQIARLETANTGKPLADSLGLVLSVAYHFEYFAGWATKLYGEQIPVPGPLVDITFREPVGVVGAIVPWNFPLSMATFKVAPALACGNAIVLKPASPTPLTAILLAELATEAGVPDDWLNVVTGPGDVAGRALVASPLVDKIAFTGETVTGREIAEVASRTLKRVSLELGGKSPAIVLGDADLEAAARGSAAAIYYNAGQCCDARSRLIVEDSVHDRFMDLFAREAASYVPGDPLDAATTLAPLISAGQRERVEGHVAIGRAVAGEPAFGGSRVDRPGFYFEPTAFVDVKATAPIWRNEIFGPVAVVQRFRTLNEAIAAANDTDFGLAATVWTGDAARGLAAARELRAGNVSINEASVDRVEAPFGGFKQSGYGRELGRYALDLYTETKNVLIRLPDDV